MLAKSLEYCSIRQQTRVLPLDGLRGFLALGVFFNHAGIYQTYLQNGLWLTETAFFTRLGQLGVALFFMLTAYLFYGRLIAEHGRPAWGRLYLGRLFRIGPVYLVAVAGMFAVVALGSGFQARVGGWELGREVAAWLALGAGPRLDLNGYPDTRHLLAGVTWTLQAEWLFYAALPLLAFVARSGARLAAPAAGLMGVLAFLTIAAPVDFPACVGPFLAGMVCAALPKAQGASRAALAALVAVAVAVILAGVSLRAPAALLALGGVFYLLVSGCSIFGLLTCRLACWLGSLSYPVYLLHGLVLSQLAAIGPVRAHALASPGQFWLFVLAALTVVLAVAQGVHSLIEQPGIRLGRLVADRLNLQDRVKEDVAKAVLCRERHSLIGWTANSQLAGALAHAGEIELVEAYPETLIVTARIEAGEKYRE